MKIDQIDEIDQIGQTDHLDHDVDPNLPLLLCRICVAQMQHQVWVGSVYRSCTRRTGWM